MFALPLSYIFTVDEVFRMWTAFSCLLCLLLPSSVTSKYNSMFISGTELTIHYHPPIQIEKRYHLNRTTFFLWQLRTQWGFPFRAAKHFSCSFFFFPISHNSTHPYTRYRGEIVASITWTKLSRLHSHYIWFSAFSFSCQHVTDFWLRKDMKKREINLSWWKTCLIMV